ncbi:transposase [Limosilactobacillus fermentum]|uniref:transposase n=1 Tax=Limosilactobacillus fermentum TaxID=1613 RepID=UPI00301D221F
MKITYSTTTKLRLLSQFQNVNESLKVFADYHNVGAGSLKRWIQQYLTGGLANLERPVHNRRYPKKLKLRAVRDYRNHRLPTKEILLKYDIRGLSQLRNWVILYNNGKEPVRKRVRKMGRKVSYDEKIEIVKWVLKHTCSYPPFHQLPTSHLVAYLYGLYGYIPYLKNPWCVHEATTIVIR